MRFGGRDRVTALSRQVENLPQRLFVGLSGGAVALPILGAALVDGAAAISLGAIGVIAAGAVAWAAQARAKALSLPLEIAPVALSGRVDGQPMYRFRVRLGNGRALRSAQARVTWRPTDGEPAPLVIVEPSGPRVGAWTVLAFDPLHRCDGPGTFTVEVTAQEGARTWTSQATYAHDVVRPGRFEAGVAAGRRLTWSASWCEVETSAP